jgi:stearoyl-CoA desaturase (delta-9 desaturase)
MLVREAFSLLASAVLGKPQAALETERSVSLTAWSFLAFHLLFVASWFIADWHPVGSLIAWSLLQFGVHAGYNRYFSHRSFKTHPWFEFVLACLGCLAYQDGPLWWASVHRHHHRRADTDNDLHSPRHGFWHAHIGWLLQKDARDRINWDLVADLRRPIPLWVQRNQIAIRVLYVVTLALVAGLPAVLTYCVVPVVLCWHATMATNSFCHSFGSRPAVCPPRGSCGARNNAIIAWLNLGEGWHNNHHAHPGCANHGFHRWYEVDIAYVVLLVLEKLGIIWDVKRGFGHPAQLKSRVTPIVSE